MPLQNPFQIVLTPQRLLPWIKIKIYDKSRSTLRSFTIISVYLWPFFISIIFQILQQLNSILWSQILINPFTINLNHWRIRTSPQTFNFLNGVHEIGSYLSTFNFKIFLTGFNNFLFNNLLFDKVSNLEMEFAYPLTIEHGIKWSNFIYIHFVDFTHFSDSFHGIERQEIIILFLSKME